MKTERAANFELLRLVAMAFVVVLHLQMALGTVDYEHSSLRGGEWLNAFAVVGVNCFVLLSGYFGIRFRLSKLLFLFYSIVWVCLADWGLSLLWPRLFHFTYAWQTIVPYSRTSNWFIPAYIGLCCFAPLLNRALAGIERRELTRIVAALTLVNVWAFFVSVRSVNPNGYTLAQFLYLYVLAAWLRGVCFRHPLVPLLVYVALALLTGLWAVCIAPGYSAFAYNNPLVLGASVALFLAFGQLRLQSRWINRLGGATFTVFLLHYVVLQYVKTHFRPHPLSMSSLLELSVLFTGVFVAAFLLHEVIVRSWAKISSAKRFR